MKQYVSTDISPSSDPLMRSNLNNLTLPLQQPALDDLAHELRQPLSVIESLAYYLELTSQDAKACRHLQQIQAMVLRANQILANYKET